MSLARALAVPRGAVDTSSDAWRHECEVRYVASMPGKEYRKHFLAGVRRQRGVKAAKRIVDDLWTLYRSSAK